MNSRIAVKNLCTVDRTVLVLSLEPKAHPPPCLGELGMVYHTKFHRGVIRPHFWGTPGCREGKLVGPDPISWHSLEIVLFKVGLIFCFVFVLSPPPPADWGPQGRCNFHLMPKTLLTCWVACCKERGSIITLDRRREAIPCCYFLEGYQFSPSCWCAHGKCSCFHNSLATHPSIACSALLMIKKTTTISAQVPISLCQWLAR